jgi:predicted nucleic acid-binding protein
VIVLDASAVIEWLLQTPTGAKIAARLTASAETAHAPHLVDVEVLQVMRRLVRSRTMTAARGQAATQDLAELRLTRYPHDTLLARAWELRNNLSAYDAMYVALAESLDAPLLTCDARISTAPGHSVRVEVM